VKFRIAFKDSFDWPSYFMVGAFAGIYHLENSNPEYGQGLQGYAKRYGAAMGDQIISNVVTEGMFPAMLHEDPRFFRRGYGRVRGRIAYAASRVLITRTDKGSNRVNFSEVAGNAVTAGISNLYYPASSRRVSDNLQKMGLQIGTDALENILKEFWPDIKHKYFSKKDRQPAGQLIMQKQPYPRPAGQRMLTIRVAPRISGLLIHWSMLMTSTQYVILANVFFSVSLIYPARAQSQQSAPLKLVTTIELPDVTGRIDHLAIDLRNHRFFLAALGNNTVEVVDIEGGKRLHTIRGLAEPQGLLALPEENRLFIANGKDGTLRMFDASSFDLLKTIQYSEDADNIRLDASSKRIWVGYNSGVLGSVDFEGNKISNIALSAHPESFQLERNGSRIFVNLPGSMKVAVVDRNKSAVIASWGTGLCLANFPMALDEANHRLFVVCRLPARMVVLDTFTGKTVVALPAVGDCGDVFYDSARRRIYATGGEGAISVFQQQDPDHYNEIAKIATVKGARTGYFSSDLGRLFVAARRDGSHPAEIRIYQVQ
jgi:DNA-binding beta-propeller fold protein YncE